MKWKSISELNRKEMQFVLVYEDGEIRTLLWNPRGFWEQPNPVGAIAERNRPTHFIELPEPPK
jgi:hypothetical protein